MNSVTPENGFAEFNAIQFLLNAEQVDQQNSIIELNDVVNCEDLTTVGITFNQRARAFNFDENYLEVSNDNGTSWVPFQVNADFVTNADAVQGELTVDVSEVAAGNTNVKIRFRWVSDPRASEGPDYTDEQMNNFGSGYGWMIDDLVVSSLPENELIIGETYYQDFFEKAYVEGNFIITADGVTDIDNISSFEYHTQPDFSTRPFNFACEVTNGGSAEQTGVSMVVTFNDPDGGVSELGELVSDPITLAPGVTDTLRLYGVIPSNWAINEDLPNGAYVMDFEVVQDQEDEFPGNNVGVSLITRISDNSTEGTGAIIQHENSLTQQGAAGEDVIHGTRFSFTEGDANRFIRSIRFALNDASIDGVGEQIFLNVRTGSVLDSITEENPVNLLFSYEEGDENAITYEVAEEDLSTTSTPNWIEIELPTPVLIEPGLIYQAEMRLPLFGEPLIFVGLTPSREAFVSAILDLADGEDAEWGFFGSSGYNLAFGVEQVLSSPEISYESGIKLVQNYPNPVVDNTMIQFQLDESSAVTFEVFDITGKLVHSEDLGNVPALTNQLIDFNRAGLASGTYTYGIVTETERLTRKMIIQ
ncbi:MAG: T9SS type A sorting domain-containing protein [Cryomorphaceae bacterium]